MQLLDDVENRSESVATLSTSARERIRNAVDEACRPIAQSWPMKTFAYRNPLRGWEHLPFDEAVRQAERLLKGKGYLPNADYRQLYQEGQITAEALDQALERVIAGIRPQTVTCANRSVTAADVLRLHLRFGFDSLAPALLTWQLHGEGAGPRLREDLPADHRQQYGPLQRSLLWASTLSVLKLTNSEEYTAADRPAAAGPGGQNGSAAAANPVALPPANTLADWLGVLAEASLVDLLNDQMIKWSSAFLDEGLADWQMPGRRAGFYHGWRALAVRDFGGRLLGIKQFKRRVRELPDLPEDAVALSLNRLGIPEPQWVDYLSRHLAQLPGWAGFIRWRGENPAYAAQEQHPIDPLQYLAVRLFYEVGLVEGVCAREWGINGTLPAIAAHWSSRLDEYRQLQGGDHRADDYTRAMCEGAWRLFQLAQFLQWTPDELTRLSADGAHTLLSWLDAFPAEQHGAVWLEALETSYRRELLSRLADHQEVSSAAERPRAQLVLCIDARSESFRRHIEAQGPYETFGYAGFFGVPISYQAFDSSERAALCPVIVSPGFAVDEVPRSGEDTALDVYAAGSRWNRLGQHLFHDLKSNPLASFMLIDLLGLLFSARLTGKTFLRGTYDALKAKLRAYFIHRVATYTPVDRSADNSQDGASLPYGFTPAERATFVEKGLRAIGLTKNFGRFIVLCGHGSTSENNPYFAAYNCGACGGGHGDPNARVFAMMANQPHVRETLKQHGLAVPDDTWFLAAKHNTATDQVTFYDLEALPASHLEDLRQLTDDLSVARCHQALERCQRMPQAPVHVSPQAAAEHLELRTVDWANVRPEWGLSSNAAFILGRRALTKGLDLGGRVFLHSYDPEADADGAILEALMNAPLVVAQWISMEYYFSAVDPTVYGSGSKVTHNVVSGVGVMHGSHGDLQSGLPLQSVNDGDRHYHKPVRLLAIIEAPTSRISTIIQKHTLLQQLFHNQWVNLVALDPATRKFHRYRPDSEWEPCL